MSVEVLINKTPMETRVAMVERGKLWEIMLERNANRGIVGNIYRGKVVRILPGMQAAFVEIGRDKAGFLHATDIMKNPGTEGDTAVKPVQDIRQLLHDGQMILVQAYKDPIGTKGPRLTTVLSASSRYLVYMPGQAHIGISQRIEDEDERNRLREAVENFSATAKNPGGYIVRTLAEGIDEQELQKDIDYLHDCWEHICEDAKKITKPGLVYEDLQLHLRLMRDIANTDIEKITIDCAEGLGQLTDFAKRFYPEMVERIFLYTEEVPLFSQFSINDEINRALLRKVPLVSGGYLVIDQTEAMTTIDVNTGAFVGRRNLEDTIFKTNLEAAFVIARQLRLRNLGGILIVDFIDMQDEEHRREVLRLFEKFLSKDRAKTAISSVSALGLVEMTRKRTSESIAQLMCEPCCVCDGRGQVKSVVTVCYDLLREIAAFFNITQFEKMLVIASPTVIERLLDEEAHFVAQMEAELGKPIEFRAESVYTPEQYDIVPI